MITNECINRGIDYILEHINETLTVDEIAKQCNFSKFYFSRMFKLATGESVYEFIKRVKMEQSAVRLKVEKGRSITDISCDYGYSASNYSSAFKQHHKISPIQFRRSIMRKSLVHPFFNGFDTELESFEACSKKISIEMLEDYRVIYERHKGSYADLSTNWCRFQDKYRQYTTDTTLLIERTFDDPSITNVNDCLYDLCMTVDEACPIKNTYNLKGGKFAIYHFKGRMEEIYFAYQSLFNVWIGESGYYLDERYGFEIYRKVACDTMEIDLCIPIK